MYLVCKGGGGPLEIVAYINDQISIKRIPDHLGLNVSVNAAMATSRSRMRFWGS